jgi:hypothetical protein
MGPAKLATDPQMAETPRRIATMPKYIGCRHQAKGPSVMNTEGGWNGLTVVFTFLKSLSVQRLSTPPNMIGRRPTKLQGSQMIVAMGKAKCSPSDTSNAMLK